MKTIEYGLENHYPLVNIQKAIEKGHRNSWLTHFDPWKMVIFHSKLLVYQRVKAVFLHLVISCDIPQPNQHMWI